MIFAIEGHIKKIMEGMKTMTRRPSDRYEVGRLYAVQLGRCKPGIPEGKIYISMKSREWKPDLLWLPEDAIFARKWHSSVAGYPIKEWAAMSEGGYTPEEFEELYEKMYPGWKERWAYWFSFFSTEEIEECQKSSRSPT